MLCKFLLGRFALILVVLSSGFSLRRSLLHPHKQKSGLEGPLLDAANCRLPT